MIITVVYIVGVILCVYPFSRILLDYTVISSKPDSMDIGFSIFGALFGAMIWPIFLTAYLAYKLSKTIWMKFMDETEKEKSPIGR